MSPTRGLLALILFFGAALLSIRVSAQPAETAPPYLPITRFGINGGEIDPGGATLSAEEEAQLVTSARAMTFPRYLYSGCDDRAHAAYMMLPASIRSKVMKIWVVTTSKYTSAIRGTITSTRREAEYQAVDWGFHVALAYRTAGGLRIFDPALRPGEVISEADWFLEMTVSPLSFWTLTQGSVYQFYPTAKDPFAANEQHWSGNSYGYEGDARNQYWIPQALARDAVGVDAISGSACADFSAIASNPGELLARLNAGSADTTDPCRESFEKYLDERARWITLLSGGQD